MGRKGMSFVMAAGKEQMMPGYPMEDIERIKDVLVARKQTIAVAESVTAGQLQAALSLAEDARRFFQGGITAYNVGQKCRQLKVEPVHALEINGVSAQVAGQMAQHVAETFCSHWGIGVTGYAAPVPEKGIHQPFAWFAIAEDGRLLHTEKMEAKADDALKVQLYYVRTILAALKRVLSA
jgi:PncC family amidohydrolase